MKGGFAIDDPAAGTAAATAGRRYRQSSTARGTENRANCDRGQRRSFRYPGGPEIIRDLTTTIYRGDRIGIIGPNGAGKTTLLQLLLGQLQPDRGEIETGTHLAVGYFDQLHNELDPTEA